MKKLLTIFLVLFSMTVFSETYTCSVNLSQFGQSGVETTIFKRDGKKFIGVGKYNKNYPVQILTENSNDIILYELDQSFENTSILITLISKKSLKYTQEFMMTTGFSKEKVPKLLGDCLVN